MSTPPTTVCPQCSKPFPPRRRNQFYCTTQCRIDANNEQAKMRYATFREEAHKIEPIKSELKKLRAYVASAVVVIQGVIEVDRETISHEGREYKRRIISDRLDLGVTLQEGGALKIGITKIRYRPKHSRESIFSKHDDCWEYAASS